MKFLSVVVILGLLGAVVATGTTIIVRQTSDYIVLGADSLTVNYVSAPAGGHYKKAHKESYTCKINQFNDTFFAHAGYMTDFVVPLAEQAARQGRSIAEKAGIYDGMVKQKIEADMEAVRQRMPDEFAQLMGTKGTPFEAGFFGIERGRAVTAFVVYALASAPGQRVVLRCQTPGCVQISKVNTWATFLMGRNDEIMKIGGDVDFWNKYGSDESIRKLIGIEETARPDLLGGPINLLSISDGQVKWIQHAGECPEIKPTVKARV